MARAQLAALACAGLLIGGHEQVGAVLQRTDLAPALRCWEEASHDVQRRLDLVLSVQDRVGDRAFARARARAGTWQGVGLQARPAWLACFE